MKTDIPYDSKIEIQFPRVIHVQDYHEFGLLEYYFREFLGIPTICVKEIGYDEFGYTGLIYLAKDK